MASERSAREDTSLPSRTFPTREGDLLSANSLQPPSPDLHCAPTYSQNPPYPSSCPGRHINGPCHWKLYSLRLTAQKG